MWIGGVSKKILSAREGRCVGLGEVANRSLRDGSEETCENRRYRALSCKKTHKKNSKIIQNRRLFGVGFVLPN